MIDDEETDACEATPEEMADWDRKNQEWREFIREQVAAGWLWDEGKLTLTASDDPDVSVLFDPFTLEGLYSPKLVKQLGEQIDRRQRSDEQ